MYAFNKTLRTPLYALSASKGKYCKTFSVDDQTREFHFRFLSENVKDYPLFYEMIASTRHDCDNTLKCAFSTA